MGSGSQARNLWQSGSHRVVLSHELAPDERIVESRVRLGRSLSGRLVLVDAGLKWLMLYHSR